MDEPNNSLVKLPSVNDEKSATMKLRSLITIEVTYGILSP